MYPEPQLLALASLADEQVAEAAQHAVQLLLADDPPSSPEHLRLPLEALAHALLCAAREALSPPAFSDWLGGQGFSTPACEALRAAYESALPELRAAVQAESRSPPGLAFHSLHWRLDVRLASRAAQQEAVPSYLLQVKTEGGPGGGLGSVWVEADRAALLSLSAAVNEALKQSATVGRRLGRKLSVSRG